MHHIFGIIGAITVLIAGDYTVALSTGNLVSEFSTLFMNLRWRLLKHKMTEHWLFIPANLMFFVAYIISRLFFMLALLIRNYQIYPIANIFNHPNKLVASCAILTTGMQIILYLLQLYWFKLILQAFMRALAGGKPTSKADVDLQDKPNKNKKD